MLTKNNSDKRTQVEITSIDQLVPKEHIVRKGGPNLSKLLNKLRNFIVILLKSAVKATKTVLCLQA